ncbi:hypothetical protein [Altericroceibacterium endophyticum]|uniref:Uncharacterized protein n=1 Tax=Altericroceibacterium endophyticum TaxID=1808508 RepID=A0A6I4T894_9SPHN|nr:hypothetical protein [Altericroceibacterium endophyticum]MXO66080.1 hypothetical protein [Altericroceibacterium endophyticum]
MTIRFAAPPSRMPGPLPKERIRLHPPQANNDNAASTAITPDGLLRAALRHFNAHGLAAAHHARDNAAQAFFDGNRESYRWWLQICRLLDRKVAEDIPGAAFCDEETAPKGRSERK